jgi:NADH-quinone oxidoreductase subunit F
VLGLQPAQIIDEVKRSYLRGRGGAGFPTGLKWSFIPKDSPRPKYLAVNADESEPGTFKDRYILENDPHMLLEGIAISSFGLGVHTAYIYVRGEFRFQTERLQEAVDEAYRAGIFGKTVLGRDFRSSATWSAGGRTSAAKRPGCSSPWRKKGWPRLKPPSPRWWGCSGAPPW